MKAGTKSTAAGLSGQAGMVVLGFTIVALSSGWAANSLAAVVWNVAGYAVRFVPSLVLVAAQSVQAHGFGHCGVVEYLPQFPSCVSIIAGFGGMR